MEFNGCHINEVSDPVDIEIYSDRSQTPSPTPVLSTNVCCDLEDILSDVRKRTNNSHTAFIIAIYTTKTLNWLFISESILYI